MKKRTIILLLMCIVIILIGIGFIPVKYAVYADKDTINAYYNGKLTSKERRKYFGHTIENWLDKGGKYNSAKIVETIVLNGRLKLKRSGIKYIGDIDHSAPLLYFEVQNKSPFKRLNSSFDPSKVKNYYVIKYYALNGDDPAEWKDGYYEKKS